MKDKLLALWRRAWKSSFARNVAIVASGTAAAQVITILFAPIITRQYGAEAFGMLSTFLAMLNVLTPIASLNYHSAIGLPEQDGVARKLGLLSVWVAAAISLVAAVVLGLWGHPILASLGIKDAPEFFLLIPVAMFFGVLIAIANQWMLRTRMFRVRSSILVWQSFLVNVAKVSWGAFFMASGLALVVIATVGKVLHAAALFTGIRARGSIAPSDVPMPSYGDLARKYSDFPRFQMPLSVMNAMSEALPVFLLGMFFGPKTVGFYALTRTVLWAPVNLLAQAVGEVFYPQINETVRRNGNARGLILKATAALGAIVLLPCLVLAAFGPWLFAFAFGAEWVGAGEFSQWMSAFLFSAFINRPSMASAPALGLQRMLLINAILGFALKGLGIYLGAEIFGSAVASIAMFSAAGVLANIFIITTAVRRSAGVPQQGGRDDEAGK